MQIVNAIKCVAFTILIMWMIVLTCSAPAIGRTSHGLTFCHQQIDNPPSHGLVGPFIDLHKTGLGTSIRYLIWRELLGMLAIWGEVSMQSDDADSRRTIVTINPGEAESLAAALEEGDHQVAVDMARACQSPAVLWGEVQTRGEQVFVYTFLTLHPDMAERYLPLTLELPAPRQSGLTDHFQVRVLKTRFSFPHLQSTRQDLFSRRLVTTQRTVLYSRPQITSDAVATIDKGTFLESTDMVGSWFKVKPINRTTASDLDSEFVYVDSRNVLVLPREVTFPARYAWLFNSLCQEGQNEDGRDNRCQVFDVRSSLAYGLEFGFQQVDAAEHREGSQTNRGVKRWINSTMVRPGLTMLAEYLMAGLVYYQNREYQEAYHQFLQFVNHIHHRENSENIAIAYQFRGASLYRRRDTGGVSTIPVRADQREEVVEFEEAREVAPYDPSVYSMVAVAQYKIARELNLNQPESEPCKNLASVLQRYPQHEQTRALLNHLGCQYAEKDWIQVILHVERILSRKTHINMPQAVVAGDRPTASPHMQSSRLRLKNNTLLPIRLYYVQAESAARRSADWVPAAGKVDLQSGEQQPLNNLSPGTYEVAAEIPNNDKIGTIYGIQEYQAGKDYELTFHMQWRGK